MVSRKPGKVGFPTLFVAHDWIEAHCVVPDGFLKGTPWEFYDWQSWCILNFYRLKPSAKVGQLAPAFKYRRSQIVLPQKSGKAPYTAAHICNEAVGPALFAGWSEGGEVWDCRDHGCGCGWAYEYEPGEAMGMEWPTPLIQVTATSEEQTDNIYDALRPMIDDGPLTDLIPKTGEEFIRLPNKGRIDVVTSNARSRLGQRVTFVPQDETGIWTAAAGMIAVGETQRRGLAGMGGRAEETTNGWDPSEDSVAQRTADADLPDVFRFHPLAPPELDYAVKRDRRRIHAAVYKGSTNVDLDAIEAEAAEILIKDPHQAERFFGNRIVAGSAKAFDVKIFNRQARPDETIAPGRTIAAGFDGSKRRDETALVITDIETGLQQVAGHWKRPEGAPVDEWEIPVAEVTETVRQMFKTWKVWRLYCDPPYWQTEIDEWAGEFGDDKVVKWWTNRYKVMAYATKNWVTALADGSVTHDGDPDFLQHVKNAVMRKTRMRDDDDGSFLWFPAKDGGDSPRKVDIAITAIISWACRSDGVASGVVNKPTYGRASW